ncbi:MAG: nucleotidyltransferase domain-containing protein [Deltaproteobacteria bacterium]|nr:nucleotidyltransferase domain-containing protein [Deltaproteobacteria bacterium]
MINSLFKSKIRKNILARFFANESKRFYINEMARLAGTTQGTCRRELNKLVDTGILKTSREGNLQYYRINTDYPLYNEFRTIIIKTVGIEASISNALRRVQGIAYAFIFGSYARDEFKPESDIDVVVIGTVKEPHLVKVVADVEKSTGREINYHIYSLEEFKSKLRSNSFMKNIIREYILVTGDGKAFGKLLQGT